MVLIKLLLVKLFIKNNALVASEEGIVKKFDTVYGESPEDNKLM